MRKDTYLNAVLTVNAALLAGLLWTQIADQPVLASPATAQSTTAGAPTFPNAAKQRVEIVHGVRDVERVVKDLKSLMLSGAMKVEVTNLEELQIPNLD